MKKIIIIHLGIAVVLVLSLPISIAIINDVGFNEFFCGSEYLGNIRDCNLFEYMYDSEITSIEEFFLTITAISASLFLFFNRKNK